MAIVSLTPQMPRVQTTEHRVPSISPVYYQDVNADFGVKEFGLIVTNSIAIRQKIMNLLTVLVGQEHFEPEWGSDLQLRLFEPMTGSTDASGVVAHLIRFDTISAVNSFMRDQVTLMHNQCYVSPNLEQDGYTITMTYTENRSRTVDQFQFPLVLSR